MQALSRNTATVAQDFRSAGGEKLTSDASEMLKGIITLYNINRDATEANGAIGAVQKNNVIHNGNGKRSSWNNVTSPIDHSPPAVSLKAIGNNGVNNSPDGLKRRRKMSPEKDKENVNELLMKQLAFLKQQQLMFLKNLNESVMPDTERLKAVKEINEIFEKMYDHSMSVISSLEGERSPKNDNRFTIPEYLMKSNEITVIVEPKKNSSNLNSHAHHLQQLQQQLHEQNEIRKNRKQLKPKKIEQLTEDDEDMSAIESCDLSSSRRKKKELSRIQRRRHLKTISEVRDKHMVLLLERRKYCFTCRNKSADVNICHSRTSLLLHNLWRHSQKQFECHHCQRKFNRIYKLKLHKKLEMH